MRSSALTWAAKWTLAMLATARFGAAQQHSIGFSDADRAGQVKAELMNGSIEVQGYDGKTVVIEPLDPSGLTKLCTSTSASRRTTS